MSNDRTFTHLHGTEIRIKTNKHGKRIAHYYSKMQRRWFPVPVEVADVLIATGKAEQI